VQFSIWLVVFIVGVIQGIFLTAALLAMNTGNRRATRVLAALVAVLTLLILGEVIQAAINSPLELLITGANINTELAIGPLLLLFVRAVFEPDRPYCIRDGRHFLPLLIGLAIWLTLTGAMYLGIIELSESGFGRIIAGYVVFKAAFLYCYIFFADRALTRGLNETQRFVAGRQPVQMRWGHLWLFGTGVVAGFIYLTFLLGYFGMPVPDSDDIGSLLLALMIYVVSFVVLLRPWILSVRPRQADLDRYADDMRKLEQHLEQERSFLDPELTARRLAENLGVTENRLSAVLNDGMQTSFYDLVAGYRLAEFDRLARDADNRGRSVLELAYAAGFNSKASFYRLFRRSHGTTPTAFLKEVMP
jgi:AraC-like DNA-binding protein